LIALLNGTGELLTVSSDGNAGFLIYYTADY